MNDFRPSNAAQPALSELRTKSAARRATSGRAATRTRRVVGQLNGILQVAEVQLMFHAI